MKKRFIEYLTAAGFTTSASGALYDHIEQNPGAFLKLVEEMACPPRAFQFYFRVRLNTDTVD
jgi:hypothetical protein